jgi:energy-coupling factor transport system permease protein
VRLDPRVKLMTVCMLTTLAVIKTNLVNMAGICLACLLLAWLVKYPIISGLLKMKRLLMTFLTIILLQMVFTRSGAPLLSVGQVVLVTTTGLDLGIQFVLRMLILIFCAGILSTSHSRDLIQGLVQLKIPYVIAFMVTISISYIPLLNKEIHDTVTALNLRGVNLKKIALGKKVRTFSYLFVPVIMHTLEQAQDLSISLEMRGFRLKKQRTSWQILRMNAADILMLAISGAIFCLMLFI